eukprot:COSAG06_NODE_2241_length_7269_cov_9.419944_9_plen_134_part_00
MTKRVPEFNDEDAMNRAGPLLQHRLPVMFGCCETHVACLAALRVEAEEGRLQENGTLLELSLCLSRACLGKMIIFSIKTDKQYSFRTASRQQASRCVSVKDLSLLPSSIGTPARNASSLFLSAVPMFVPSLSW